MQGLKKYCQMVAEMQQEKEGTPPDVLFQLNRALELELVMG
jgi:hypothetical protein